MKTADPDIDAGPPNPPRRNCHRKPRRVVPVAPVPPRVEVPAGFAGRRTVTTGLIARFLGVAPRTVSKWVDAGALPGHRLAGSLDRRVRREDLVNFLRANGYGPEADALDPPAGRLLLVACPPAYAAAAAASGAEEVVPQPDPVSAAALVAGGWVPSAVLAHGSAGREALAAIAAVLARLAPDAARVAVLGDDAPAGPPGWAAVPESAGPAAALAALGRGGAEVTRDELVLDYLATHDPVAVLFAAYPATAVAVRAAGLVGEDLDQTLAVGVVKAARTYDEARGVPFWFHARPHLRAAVQRAIGESEEKTRFHAAAWRLGAWRPGKDDNDDWTPALYRHADRRPGPEAAADAADAVAALRAGLSGREWRVLAMRYGLTTGGVPLDTRAVAAAEGVSRQMTNRVERRAVEKARRLLGAA